MRGSGRAGAVAAGFYVVGALAAAQSPPWASLPFADPLRFTSLPLDGEEAIAPRPGEWEIGVSSGYFNVWQLTWHTGTIHKSLGLLGKPLTDREVRILEQNFPGDQFYHVDLEGTLDRVVVSRGFGGGLAVTFVVPWIVVGDPHWDAIAEDFHRTFGLGDMRRAWFPRGRSTVVIRGRRGTVERLSGLAGSGIGDAGVSVTGTLGEWLGGEHRWVVALKAPTGERGTLRGTGGWDAGLRWFATWGSETRQLRAALGYTRVDPGGRWLGVRRDDVWGALVEARTPLMRHLLARASARLDSSSLASFTDSAIGKVSFYWTLGVLAPLANGAWLAFDGGENYPSAAEAPDFSFHLQVVVRVPRRS